MSALPKAAHTPSPWWSQIEFPWDETARRAPVMVATMASYLDQLGVSARQTTVGATERDAASLRRSGHRGRPGVHLDGRGRATPHRSAQALARRSTRQGRESPWPASPSGTASVCCAPSSSACATGTTTTHRPGR